MNDVTNLLHPFGEGVLHRVVEKIETEALPGIRDHISAKVYHSTDALFEVSELLEQDLEQLCDDMGHA